MPGEGLPECLTWRCSLKLVEEQFEVADDHELPDPALLDPAGLRHLDVSLVGCSNAPGRVDTQWTFGWK